MAEEKTTTTKSEESQEETKLSNKKINLKKIILLVGGVGILLIAVGIGAMFFIGGGSHKTSSHSDSNAHIDVEEKVTHTEASTEHTSSKNESSHKKSNSHGGHTETSTQAETEESINKQSFGDIYTFKPFQLNLGNPLENRFIKIEIAVEYKGKNAQKEEIIKREAQLRDAIIGIVGRKTREFLLSPDGKDQLRREIKIKLNRFLSQPIEAVYITEMLID